MNERQVDPERIRAEHLSRVRQRIQWAYLIAVMGGATILMLAVLLVVDALAS